ncbi:unnamed protein product [Rotaria magnacalcarata]|uniref:Uncharacterized protein n=5 Tax=Rotaria magnacalcarata TaxID=392030 RepID=A0A816QMG6_9BILA|nr:unnamed protein product [Rotaria magnacalcarata]CAF1636071.1 unnamed protein product [Rotaria magnacalcarata]CAF2062964.1 unnamed protein product [Rotaria magnacalcarata]CAF2163908.1 unnamed protein product [Rotaria magnacalcarata]CAF3808340.1 unnamed protein product [Rotaria magnacalcarata]
MATTTTSNLPSKILRITDEEKVILYRLRKLYAADYKNYCKHIKLEPNIPISVKKIYNILDERQSYRRIADFFHRERLISLGKRRKSSFRKKPSRSSTRNISQVKEPMTVTNLAYESDSMDDNYHKKSNNEIMKNHIDTAADSHLMIDYDNDDDENEQDVYLSEIDSIHFEKPILPRKSGEHEESTIPRISQSSSTLSPDLLSVRTSIQKALHELDRVLLNSDSKTEQQQSLNRNSNLTNEYGQRKLDDIVRSLATTINQQQGNVRSIINESTDLLADENKRLDSGSIRNQESIKCVIARLNALVDRGNSIFDRAEKILSEF